MRVTFGEPIAGLNCGDLFDLHFAFGTCLLLRNLKLNAASAAKRGGPLKIDIQIRAILPRLEATMRKIFLIVMTMSVALLAYYSPKPAPAGKDEVAELTMDTFKLHSELELVSMPTQSYDAF
jgi:hypothetical protein